MYAPMKDQRPRTVWGGGHDDNVAMRWGLADNRPCVQIHPKIVVLRGQMVVLAGDSLMLLFRRASRIRVQFTRSSSGVSAPQYRSSASFAATPSFRQSPRMRHISSSRAVSDPGIPMADRV